MRWSFWLSTLITKLVMDKKSREAIAINANHSAGSSSNTILTCTSSGRFTGKLKEIANKRDVSYLCYLVVPKPLLVVRNNILFICSCGRSLLVLASTLSWRRVQTRSRRHTHRKCLLCFNVLVMSLCLVLDLLYTWCLTDRLHIYTVSAHYAFMLWWMVMFLHLVYTFDVRCQKVKCKALNVW